MVQAKCRWDHRHLLSSMAIKTLRRSIYLVLRGQATIHRDRPVSKRLHRGVCSKTRCHRLCQWVPFRLRKLPSRLALACQHRLGHPCHHGTRRPSRLHNGRHQSPIWRQLRVSRQQWLQWFIRSRSSGSSMHRIQVQLGQHHLTSMSGVGSRACQEILRRLGKF